MFERLEAYLRLVRPITLVPAFAAGFFLSYNLGIVEALLIGICLMLMQAVGQIINQVVDIEVDKFCKPHRPLVRGVISPTTALIIATVFTIVSIIIASFTVPLLVLVLAFSIGYSVIPHVRKLSPALLLVWQAVARGVLPPLIICHDYALAFLAGLWVLCFQSTKDIHDVCADALVGFKTLPVVMGVDNTVKFLKYSSIIISTVIIVYAVLYSPIVMILLPIALAIPHLVHVKLSRVKAENNLGWGLFYFGLLLIYMLHMFNI